MKPNRRQRKRQRHRASLIALRVQTAAVLGDEQHFDLRMYFDCDNGDDANDGKHPSRPKRDLRRLTLPPGEGRSLVLHVVGMIGTTVTTQNMGFLPGVRGFKRVVIRGGM